MMRRCVRWLEKLVIVESPNKVIKVEGLLSDPKVVPDWSFKSPTLRRLGTGPEKAIAMATTGHFMSLKEITWNPHALTAEQARLSGLPTSGALANFVLEWEISPGRKIQDTVSRYIEEKAGNLTEIIIATDPDREGELIAVHALNLIQRMFPNLGVPFSRAYMHSITADGIQSAMKSRRTDFDHNLAHAAEARHAMDRIFGFLGSSVVRFANSQMRSIGRVQTPALTLVKEREDKIAHFLETHKPSFDVQAMCHFRTRQGTSVSQVVKVIPKEKDASINWESAEVVRDLVSNWKLDRSTAFHVASIPTVQNSVVAPPKPFTMATLIAKANHQLRLSSEAVSSCLQDLFQMGFITYPRTDSSRIDASVLPSIYEVVQREFGKHMLLRVEDRSPVGEKPTKRAGKRPTKKQHVTAEALGNVEDAHEAIRPTNISMKGDDLGSSLPSFTKAVYELVRRNTLAVFMVPMRTERVSAVIHFTSGSGVPLQYKLDGKRTTEPGWSTAFRKGSGRSGQTAVERELESEATEHGAEVVPSISDEEFNAIKGLRGPLQQENMSIRSAQVQENRPAPPMLHSEGSLIEELKNNGVGRPSTYPMIVKTLLARNYITVSKGRCETTPVGRMLVETSKTTFPSIVDIGFTSSFERKLDRVAKPDPNEHRPSIKGVSLSEADFVLSSFVSTFLNHVTEATRNQRANYAERSFQQKQQSQSGAVDAIAVQSDLEAERNRAASQVPDLLESSRNYRTFTALQNSLYDYLRKYFPPSPASQWVPGSSPSKSSSYTRPYSKSKATYSKSSYGQKKRYQKR